MELNLAVLIFIGIVVVIIVLIICIFLRMSRRENRRSSHSHDSPKEHPKHLASAAQGATNFVESWAPSEEELSAFPRHSASAAAPKKPVEAIRVDETIEVGFADDLFSVKEDILGDLGMTQEELDAEQEKYDAKYEYKRRRLPVNKNFDITDYKAAQRRLKESPLNLADSNKGQNREHLAREVAKKQALARTRKPVSAAFNQSTFAETATPEQVAADRMPTHRNSLGKLVPQ